MLPKSIIRTTFQNELSQYYDALFFIPQGFNEQTVSVGPIAAVETDLHFKILQKENQLWILYSCVEDDSRWPYEHTPLSQFKKYYYKDLSHRPSSTLEISNYSQLNKIQQLEVSKELFPYLVENINNNINVSNLILFQQDWDDISTEVLVEIAKKRDIQTVFFINFGYSSSEMLLNFPNHPIPCRKPMNGEICQVCEKIDKYRIKLIDALKSYRKNHNAKAYLINFTWIKSFTELFNLNFPKYLTDIVFKFYY